MDSRKLGEEATVCVEEHFCYECGERINDNIRYVIKTKSGKYFGFYLGSDPLPCERKMLAEAAAYNSKDTAAKEIGRWNIHPPYKDGIFLNYIIVPICCLHSTWND